MFNIDKINGYKLKINSLLEQADWWYKQGKEVHDKESYNAAIEYYNKAKNYYNQPISFMSNKSLEVKKAVSFELAKAYYGVGKLEKNNQAAFTNYNMAIQCNLQVPLDAYLVVGNMYSCRDAFKNALDIYNKALKIYPNEAELYIKKGKTYAEFLFKLVGDVKKKGKSAYVSYFGNMVAFIRKYIDKNIDSERLNFYLNSAVNNYLKAVTIDRKRKGASYDYISSLYFYVENHPKAVEAYEIAIKNVFDELRGLLHFKLGYLYYKNNSKIQAIRYFRKARECGITDDEEIDVSNMYLPTGCNLAFTLGFFIERSVHNLKSKIFLKNTTKW